MTTNNEGKFTFDLTKLDEATKEAIQDFGGFLAVWLHADPRAKNYKKIRFESPEHNMDFDLILRKVGADIDVCCPLCGKTTPV